MYKHIIKSLFIVSAIAVSASSFANTERAVNLHFVNDTDNDINYSLVYNSGTSGRYLGDPFNAYLGQYNQSLIDTTPLLKAHSEGPSYVPYHYVTGILTDLDYLAFSAETPDGHQYGLKTKGINDPHYCSFTADDENQTVLAEFKNEGGQLKLYIIPASSSSCEFDVTDGFDENFNSVAPIYYGPSSNSVASKLGSASGNQLTVGEDGRKNFQAQLKKNPNLESQLNNDYVKYTGYKRLNT